MGGYGSVREEFVVKKRCRKPLKLREKIGFSGVRKSGESLWSICGQRFLTTKKVAIINGLRDAFVEYIILRTKRGGKTGEGG